MRHIVHRHVQPRPAGRDKLLCRRQDSHLCSLKLFRRVDGSLEIGLGMALEMTKALLEKRAKAKILDEWTPQPYKRTSGSLGITQRLKGKLRSRKTEQPMLAQTQSSLFRLPTELREKIFQGVLEDTRLHVQQSYGRFGHTTCLHHADVFSHDIVQCMWTQLDETHEESAMSYSRLVVWDDKYLKHKPDVRGMRQNCIVQRTHLLGLVLSCRLGYVRNSSRDVHSIDNSKRGWISAITLSHTDTCLHCTLPIPNVFNDHRSGFSPTHPPPRILR